MGAQTLAQILQAGADVQTVVGERGLGAAVYDLQEQLAHGGVDGVADQVGIQRLKDGLARQNFAGHRGGMGHAGAAERFHQRLFDDAVLDVQAQLARALLRRAPADTVGIAGDVGDFLRLYPLALFRNGRRSVVRALGDADHVFHLLRILHFGFPLILGKSVD